MASGEYLLALDQGTSSSRALGFDLAGRVVCQAQRPLASRYPRPGWVWQDADEILATSLAVCREAIAQAGRPPLALGIANQRETTILWERATGRPVAPAISWQSRESLPLVERLRERSARYQAITGLRPDAYFSATKLALLLEREPEARTRARAGDLCFGTVDSWLAFHLTGGTAHVTDVSNASRTMLFDLRQLAWSEEILADLDIPAAVLPTVVPTSGVVGTTRADRLGVEVPIAALVGDQQAALFGQRALRPGALKATWGTGAFLLVNCGSAPPRPAAGLLGTVAWQIGTATTYALEGSVFIAGAAVRWLRDSLGLIADAAETAELAAQVEDSGGVVFVPAFVGLGAPHWDSRARGAILGLTAASGRAHLARATLEAIAFQTADLADALWQTAGLAPGPLRVDGGASANDVLCQIQADLLGQPVERPAQRETTALGAALLAGIAVGAWPPPGQAPAGEEGAGLAQATRVERRFAPRLGDGERQAARARWRRAVERARGWLSEEETWAPT